jgi:hypothetical protein
MRKASIILGLGLGLIAHAAGSAGAAEKEKIVRVTPGESPFIHCTADDIADQQNVCETGGSPCVNYPNTEIEPFVDANPANHKNLIAVWQQDRWSNGGARGLVAGYTKDGGRTWNESVPPGITVCSGGEYIRASDPWVSISPDGTAYFMSLVTDPDILPAGFGDNGMMVSRSTDGGATWGDPITLVEDTSPQVLNDKNSLTADPIDSSYAYAIWDRLRDFTFPPEDPAAAAASVWALKDGDGLSGADGVELARERVKRLKAASEAAAGANRKGSTEAAPRQLEVFFEGPVYFTRTTDGGQSWEPAREIYDPGPNAQTIANQIVVPPNGNLIDFFTHIFPNGVTRLDLLRSLDKGATFETTPTPVDLILSIGTITPDLQEPVRDAAILFDVAVDPHSGALYAVWQDVRFRGVEEVAFSQSNDNGLTWSKPIRVNKTPADAANPLRQQAFVPSIEIGTKGQLVVTYYDFRNDKAGEAGELTDYWSVSCSSNCAQDASWGNEQRLSSWSFDMLHAPIARGHFLGDYMGLVTTGQFAHPVFSVADNPNRTSIYTRRIRLDGDSEISALP